MRPKITEQQRLEILRVYAEHGPEKTKPLCVSLGLNPYYYSCLASKRGVSVKKTKPLTAAEKTMLRRKTFRVQRDRRWAWARKRGMVVV